MQFIETQTFTTAVTKFMTDTSYADLQVRLAENPQLGTLIKNSGGIRKIRHALPNTGKSGGVRVIYYWVKEDATIYMLLVYPKSQKDDLTDNEISVLREIAKGI